MMKFIGWVSSIIGWVLTRWVSIIGWVLIIAVAFVFFLVGARVQSEEKESETAALASREEPSDEDGGSPDAKSSPIDQSNEIAVTGKGQVDKEPPRKPSIWSELLGSGVIVAAGSAVAIFLAFAREYGFVRRWRLRMEFVKVSFSGICVAGIAVVLVIFVMVLGYIIPLGLNLWRLIPKLPVAMLLMGSFFLLAIAYHHSSINNILVFRSFKIVPNFFSI